MLESVSKDCLISLIIMRLDSFQAIKLFLTLNCRFLGDKIVVVVQKARPISNQYTGSAAQKLRQGDIRHAVVVRTKQGTRRSDGSIIRFDDNACVLIQKTGDPIGTRVSGVVAKELRDKGFNKIVALAPRTV